MNKVNLLKTVYFLHTQVPDNMFNIVTFRTGSKETKHCDTVGCACGHLTGIIPDDKTIYHTDSPVINFYSTTISILGLTRDEWYFLFDADWHYRDPTKSGCCKRILYLLTEKSPLDLMGRSPRHRREYENIDIEKTYNRLKKKHEEGKI